MVYNISPMDQCHRLIYLIEIGYKHMNIVVGLYFIKILCYIKIVF